MSRSDEVRRLQEAGGGPITAVMVSRDPGEALQGGIDAIEMLLALRPEGLTADDAAHLDYRLALLREALATGSPEVALGGMVLEDSPTGHERLALMIGNALDTERVAAFMGGPFESGEIRWLSSWIAARVLGVASGREPDAA